MAIEAAVCGTKRQSDVVVVGAGISGMSLAYYCARAGRNVIVLESGDEPGGCLHTHRVDERFWYELGGHTCYNSYNSLLEIMRQTSGLEVLLERKRAPFRLLVNGETEPIIKRLHRMELLTHAPAFFFLKKQGRSIRDYYSPIVGSRNYAEVFSRLFAAVPSQGADEFPAEMLFKNRKRCKNVPRSWTVQRGLQSIVERIAQTPGVTVITGAEAIALRRESAGFVIETSGDAAYYASWVALAVPPPAGSRLTASALPVLSRALSRIAVSRIRSFGVAIPQEATTLERVAGIIPLDGRFFSVVSRDTIPDAALRGFTFHFAPDTTRGEAVQQIAAVLKTEMRHIDNVVEREVLLPSPKRGHAEIVAQIDDAIAGQPVLVTGNFFAGLSIEDCVQRSKSEAGRLTQQQLTF